MNSLAEKKAGCNIDNLLINKGWVIDDKSPYKNVYLKTPKEEHKKLLGENKPDYILYFDSTPIGVIEVKKSENTLNETLDYATQYAQKLNAPLIFASNGSYVETRHLKTQKPLFINNVMVEEIIFYEEACQFIEEETDSICTIPDGIVKSKKKLVFIFRDFINLLENSHFLSNNEKINIFITILFLKLLDEKTLDFSYSNLLRMLPDKEALDYLNNEIISKLQEKYQNQNLFAKINISQPEILKKIWEKLENFKLLNAKINLENDIIEYFLKNIHKVIPFEEKCFTPKYIVNLMVKLLKPSLWDRIYDPFCGTGWLLINVFNFMKNSIKNTDEKFNQQLRTATLFGRDNTEIVNIAKKNMILYGINQQNIQQLNSLKHPISEDQKYDIVLTNILFDLPNIDSSLSQKYYDGIAKNNGNAICLLHCLQSLKVGGRMAVIVPDGVLFSKNLKFFRKFLLETANLELVISLPTGVFLSYTSVKTNILYFTNAHNPVKKDGFYYYEIQNDGFTLDHSRKKIEGMHDIHKLLSIDFDKSSDEFLKENGFDFIPFDLIEKHNYVLSFLKIKVKHALHS